MRIRFTDFERLSGKVRVIEDDESKDKPAVPDKPAPQPTPPAQKPKP
jgi:hypothetical protein